MAQSKNKLKILIVDSTREELTKSKNILEEWGHEVLSASDGPSGLRTASKNSPDLVLIESNLIEQGGIEMDAAEFMKLFRSFKKLANIPVFLLSGKINNLALSRAMKAGVKAHLAKPLNSDDFEKQISKQSVSQSIETQKKAVASRLEKKSFTRISVGKKILVVDDDSFARSLGKKILRENGYVVVAAADGIEGLQLMMSFKPDLVLLDFQMPKISGLEVLKKMKSLSGLKEIPVLMVSAFSEIQLVKQALSIGAKDYLLKPIKSREIVERIEAVFQTDETQVNKKSKLTRPDDGKVHLLLLSRNFDFSREINKGLDGQFSIKRVESIDDLARYYEKGFSEYILSDEETMSLHIADKLVTQLREIDPDGLLKAYLYYWNTIEKSRKEEYLKLGIKALVKKPLDPAKLQSTIEEAFEVNLVNVEGLSEGTVIVERSNVESAAAGRELTKRIGELMKMGKRQFIIDMTALNNYEMEELRHIARFLNIKTKLGLSIRMILTKGEAKSTLAELIETPEVVFMDDKESAIEGW